MPLSMKNEKNFFLFIQRKRVNRAVIIVYNGEKKKKTNNYLFFLNKNVDKKIVHFLKGNVNKQLKQSPSLQDQFEFKQQTASKSPESM